MLTLVISTPHPTPPSDSAEPRLQWGAWAEALAARGVMQLWYPRVGRGVVAILETRDYDELHARLTEWLGFVPAAFDLYPLASRDEHDRLLHRLAAGE